LLGKLFERTTHDRAVSMNDSSCDKALQCMATVQESEFKRRFQIVSDCHSLILFYPVFNSPAVLRNLQTSCMLIKFI